MSMMDFTARIKDWWAVEAMIASHTHVYQVVHRTTYETRGPIGVSRYGNSPLAPYQYEFLALNPNPRVVTEAIREYPLAANDKFILDVFHALPSEPELKAKYQSLGYDFVRTGPILGRDLPTQRVRNDVTHIHPAKTIRQAEFANESLTNEGERIPLDSLRDKHIHNFYAEVSGQAVGWVQLVTIYPKVGCIQHLYTLSLYRGLKIGSALVERAQMEATRLGMKSIVLVPSDMAIGLAIRLGYRPLAYFTVFSPAGELGDEEAG
jgi:GNAT superfamily N-acetyltransferase